MTDKWSTRTLGEVCRFGGGAGFPQRLQGALTGEYLFIKVSDMELPGNSFRITRANNWIDEPTRKELRAKAHPANSTVFAKIGVALTYNRRRLLTRPTIVDNNMMAAIPDEEQVDPLFFYYLLKRLDFNEVVGGTALPYINASDLARFEVDLPPLPEQKAIAPVLGALDDKIELNGQMNATLEAMAQALFQSWFVDFDPVRTKLDARQLTGLDPATSALFSEHFDHKVGTIVPNGWNRKRWGDIATLEYGKSLRDYRAEGGKYRVFGTNGPIGFHHEALCNSAGIVIGRKGAYRGIHYSQNPFFVIDTAFYLKPKTPLDLKWAYYELLRFDINSMDSGSAIPSTSREDFYGIPVVVPPGTDSGRLRQDSWWMVREGIRERSGIPHARHSARHAAAKAIERKVGYIIRQLTAMLLSEITIKHFRGIEQLTLQLDRCTILIGENNTGKTSILEAVHTCLSRNLSRKAVPFVEYDFHLTGALPEPATAPPIEIHFTFAESAENEWPDAIIQGLEKAVQVRADNKQEVRFKVTASYDAALKDFALEWAFLDLNGNELPTAKNPRLVAELQQLNPAFFLTAARDAAQHFQPRSPFWAPFTRNPQIDDATREELENQIAEINQAVLDAHEPFNEVKTQVARTGNLVPLAAADLVSVEAVPARIFDMLNKTQVKLTAKSGAKLPIGQHGAGTQSLSVMFLFNAFLNARLAEAFDKDAEPLLTLEEPESHLHPSAVRSLWAILDALKGQKIIATHSGELLAGVPLKAIRRLARKAGKVNVFQVKGDTLTPDDERKIAYHVRAKRGNLLFAKSWLLVEGESEFWFLPEAARLGGKDFELEGVCVIEFAQCGLASLVKLAIELGIEWHVFVDGDQAGQEYADTARGYLAGVPEARRITILPHRDIEHSLWHHGYQQVYITAAGPAAPPAPVQPKQCPNGQPCQWVQLPPAPDPIAQTIKRAIRATSKPHLATAVVDAARQPGSPGLPAVIQTAITTAIDNAKL